LTEPNLALVANTNGRYVLEKPYRLSMTVFQECSIPPIYGE
jgi:hypothetical protein